MHPRVILNYKVVEASKARLPAITSATLHGRGVFTTVAVYGGRAFQWPRHWARLMEHAQRAGVERTLHDETTVGAALSTLIEENKVGRGRARVTILARAERGLWKMKSPDGLPSDLLITTGEARAADADDALALTVSPHRTNTLAALAGVKSVNYLEQVLAWEEGRGRGFDEVVRLNERGEVVSASMANLFWVTEGTLHTPALATGAVEGTTRACVLELAAGMSVPVVEGVYDLAHLGDAEEIFLTSVGLGVGMVTTFDFRRYAVSAGSVAPRLREAFRQLTLQS
ncbi:MAG TPA: aminotransferase class IV [Pyrinomonadaceae bacterium]|nr:aminotransferase class IV [Pyrinomonadaceae bacterium]